MLGGCKIEGYWRRGRSEGSWFSKVTGGKAAVSGAQSSHVRPPFHRSSYSSCNIIHYKRYDRHVPINK